VSTRRDFMNTSAGVGAEATLGVLPGLLAGALDMERSRLTSICGEAGQRLTARARPSQAVGRAALEPIDQVTVDIRLKDESCGPNLEMNDCGVSNTELAPVTTTKGRAH